MKAFIIYKEDFPWDVRVEKLALSLNKHKIDVTIISQNLGNRPTIEQYDQYQVHRIPSFQHLPKFVQKLVNFPFWFNPFWIFRIYQSVKGSKNPTLIVRDLPLVKSALLISKFIGARVIYDMAEVYPEMYASSATYYKQGLITKILKNSRIAARYESSILEKVDHTLVMIEESRDRLLQKGVSKEKISIVSNTPPIEKFEGHIKNHEGKTIYLVYVGFLTRLRGIDLLISAARHYIDTTNDEQGIYIDIVGKGSAKEELNNLVTELKLENNVRVHGWLEQSEVQELMARANVGALTYRVCGHWNHTIPNKIFDYMLAGLPIITTPVIPITRIVEKTKSGVVAKDATPHAISEALYELSDPKVRNLYARNGNTAVHDRYNWSEDEKKLISLFSNREQES